MNRSIICMTRRRFDVPGSRFSDCDSRLMASSTSRSEMGEDSASPPGRCCCAVLTLRTYVSVIVSLLSDTADDEDAEEEAVFDFFLVRSDLEPVLAAPLMSWSASSSSELDDEDERLLRL